MADDEVKNMTKKSLFARLYPLAGIGLLLGAALNLSACASLVLGVEGTPPRFTIAPVDFVQTVQSQLEVRLVIADPKAEAAFDTSRITKSPSPLRYEYYAKGEWSDRAPDLFRIFLERSFENSGRVETVGDRGSLPLGDYALQTDIRDFHIEVRDGQSVAKISYFARLLDGRNRSIATQLFTASEPVMQGPMMMNIEAFNRAATRAGDATVNWTVQQITKQQISLAN